MREISLSDDLIARLESLTVPLFPTPADVIGKLLDHYDRTYRRATAENAPPAKLVRPLSPNASLMGRIPRERGVTFELDGHKMQAVSVRDMYEQVLKFIVDKGYSKQLKPHVPFRTSRQRYLIADRPVHPNGNDFVITVKYGGYFMEAHKDYKNAVEHLRKLVEKLGITLRYVG